MELFIQKNTQAYYCSFQKSFARDHDKVKILYEILFKLLFVCVKMKV